MNKYFFIGFILLFSTPLFSQAFKNDSIKLFIDKSIDLIKENSIHTENLDLIKHELYNKSKNLNSLNETPLFYGEVFKLVNDLHGSLTYKGENYG